MCPPCSRRNLRQLVRCVHNKIEKIYIQRFDPEKTQIKIDVKEWWGQCIHVQICKISDLMHLIVLALKFLVAKEKKEM